MEDKIMQSEMTAPAEEAAVAQQDNPLPEDVSNEAEIQLDHETSDLTQPSSDIPCEETALPESLYSENEESSCDILPSDITRRLADEFVMLREEFPQLRQPEQLPDVVLEMAVENNITLLDAYLRFCHEERKRVQREIKRRRDSAARSSGSLMQGDINTYPEQESFLRAFRTALK